MNTPINIFKFGYYNKLHRLILSWVFIVFFQPVLYGQNNIFQAGASTANITPPLGLGIVGNFGVPPPANHVHDDLHARSLVLDDGKVKLVFVVVDNVGVIREVLDEAKRIIFEETRIPKEQILISSNHTHSATSASGSGDKRGSWNADLPFDDYQRFLIRRIADGVRLALNNLEPARIGWGAGNVPQHVFNRRWKMKSPVINPFGEKEQVLMNPGVANPALLEAAGPTDPQVSFISVQSLQGRPIGILANYSLHYVGGVPNDHISADYFAIFADRIQELVKADRQSPLFVGIMSNGTSGDVNNINVGGPVEKHPPYAKIRIVANDVAEEVFQIYKNLQYKNWVPLKAAYSELNIEVRRPDSKMIAYADKVLAKPGTEVPVHRLEKTYAQRTLQMLEWPARINVPMQVFSIGDLGIAAIPFEVFTEIGLEIKARSPFKSSFTIELANGSFGYLPSPKQHKLGGYETWLGTNKVETDASVKIVNEILKLFNQVK
ncbi:neutral/alkaline non-lysosomal ceramidase N-terminal domain-containing protein [Daejeonella sp.]|uniref:neutral/alkaline non-lysosomal ceramidase N-terminal domain-containing protein n=1 Tax=Daejeonella sp. TaxID=2805397 RepID=UPI0030BC682C